MLGIDLLSVLIWVSFGKRSSLGSIPSRVNARKGGIDPKLEWIGNEANKLSNWRWFEHGASSFSLSDFAHRLCAQILQASTYGNDLFST